ncbi:hypothetical protein K440DRAFT_216995 [Wilcoxina mikolae CBS 423.85]|nr:hypothetical protein K440DRAFT_216995 [Wilcoxina mikolae CBS 423.85]
MSHQHVRYANHQWRPSGVAPHCAYNVPNCQKYCDVSASECHRRQWTSEGQHGKIIRVARPWTIRRWSESKQANGEPLVKVPKDNAHLINLQWTTEEQAKLQQLVDHYESQGEGGTWRVHQWRLACFSLVLGDTEDKYPGGDWREAWPLETWVQSPIFRWLRARRGEGGAGRRRAGFWGEEGGTGR